jgi:hypothetical protein
MLPPSGSTQYETQGISSGLGTAVTSNASADTKGAVVAIGGAISFDYDWIWVTFTQIYGQGSGGYRFLVDIGAANGGSFQTIAADLATMGVGGYSATSENSYLLPVRVDKGATIYARCQDTTGGGTLYVSVVGAQGSVRLLRGFRGLANCTDLSGSDPATTFTLVDGGTTSWQQVQAPTAQRIAGIIPVVTPAGVISWDTSKGVLEVGWGSAGNKRTLFQIPCQVCGDVSGGVNVVQHGGPFPCDLPLGARLATRVTQSDTSTNTIGVFLYGLIP